MWNIKKLFKPECNCFFFPLRRHWDLNPDVDQTRQQPQQQLVTKKTQNSEGKKIEKLFVPGNCRFTGGHYGLKCVRTAAVIYFSFILNPSLKHQTWEQHFRHSFYLVIRVYLRRGGSASSPLPSKPPVGEKENTQICDSIHHADSSGRWYWRLPRYNRISPSLFAVCVCGAQSRRRLLGFGLMGILWRPSIGLPETGMSRHAAAMLSAVLEFSPPHICVKACAPRVQDTLPLRPLILHQLENWLDVCINIPSAFVLLPQIELLSSFQEPSCSTGWKT